MIITSSIIERFREACKLKQKINPDRILEIFSGMRQQSEDNHKLPVRIFNGTLHAYESHTMAALQFYGDPDPHSNDLIEIWSVSPTQPALEHLIRSNQQVTADIPWIIRAPLLSVNLPHHPTIGKIEVDSLRLLEAFEAGAWQIAVTTEDLLILPVPDIIEVDSENRLHSEKGPAIRIGSASGYYLHGIEVPFKVIEEADTITVDDIHRTANIEVRRIMTDRYGLDRFMIDTGATEISVRRFNRRIYRLYRNRQSFRDVEEAMVVVRVTNATAEPDGTFKDYWLRVPPWIDDALEAVAWTFNLSVRKYKTLFFES